jgi:hypothetical protein
MRKPKTPAPKTNTQMLMHLMEHAKTGPLIQAFILHGLEQYAKRVAAKTPAELDNPMIAGHAWHACAVEVRDTIARHLDR